MTDIIPYRSEVQNFVTDTTSQITKNANRLVNNLVKEAMQTLVLPNTLAERLETKAEDFLKLSFPNTIKMQTVKIAESLFEEKLGNAEIKLSDKQSTAVSDALLYIKEKVALAETAIEAESGGISSVDHRKQITSMSQTQAFNNRVFLEGLATLLEKTQVKYEGYEKYPDVEHSLAELIESKFNPENLNKISGKSRLEKLLKLTLIEADGHFKCEKDQRETSDLELLTGLSARGKRNSRYLELGSSSPSTNLRESNGITLRKDFAIPLDDLLRVNNIVRPDPRFRNSDDLAHLRTFALEAAAEKARLQLDKTNS